MPRRDLFFTDGSAIAAAELILDRTALGTSPLVESARVGANRALHVTVRDDTRLSSGEDALVDVLCSVSTTRGSFGVVDLLKMDEATRSVAVGAIAMACGVARLEVVR